MIVIDTADECATAKAGGGGYRDRSGDLLACLRKGRGDGRRLTADAAGAALPVAPDIGGLGTAPAVAIVITATSPETEDEQ